MPAVTIRNLSEATHRALKVRAAQHGRLGTALAERSRRLGLTNEDIDALSPARDRTPAEPMSFE